MAKPYAPPRTFGDLLKRSCAVYGSCRFCKATDRDVRKYSARHYICPACIEPRKDVVLPHIVKREKFEAKLEQIRQDNEAMGGAAAYTQRGR